MGCVVYLPYLSYLLCGGFCVFTISKISTWLDVWCIYPMWDIYYVGCAVYLFYLGYLLCWGCCVLTLFVISILRVFCCIYPLWYIFSVGVLCIYPLCDINSVWLVIFTLRCVLCICPICDIYSVGCAMYLPYIIELVMVHLFYSNVISGPQPKSIELFGS